jgi:biotin carboxyl carrier protein
LETASLVPTRLNIAGDLDQTVEIDGDRVSIEGSREPLVVRAGDDGRVSVVTPAGAVTAVAAVRGDVAWVSVEGHVFELKARHAGHRGTTPGTTPGTAPRTTPRTISVDDDALMAPMPATVVRILVAPGAKVASGDLLIALEAMKMELGIRAPHDGLVHAIHCREGELVQPGVPLLEMG